MEIKLKTPEENFLGLGREYSEFENSRIVILPIPFETSTSYGKGTAHAPEEIIKASHQIEFYDIELEREICLEGIATCCDFVIEHKDNKKAAGEIASYIKFFLNHEKVPIILGGEHSITLGSIMAFSEYRNDFTVLHMDAHCDLYQSYQNNPYSHASVMRRVYEIYKNIVSMGIRSVSEEEVSFIKSNKIHVFFADKMSSKDLWDNIIETLNDNVYITFDFDFFDPSLIPSVGTPEPGGFLWTETLNFLKNLALRKNIIGADFVEFSPISDVFFPNYIAAKFIYKIIGYIYSFCKS